MGAPVGRRQSRVESDVAMRLWYIIRSRLRSLLFRGGRESDLREELQLHLERETERLESTGLSREDARLQARRLFGGVEQIKEAVTRRARNRRVGRARARYPAWASSPRARLAVHDRGGTDPRHRHRRQHRDLQRRERGTVPSSGVRRPRSTRQHLSERSRRQADGRHRVCRLHGDGGVHRHLCRDDGRQHPEPPALSQRRRRARRRRRVRDRDIPQRAGIAAVARSLVRRHGGAARGSNRRRPRTSGVDQTLPRRPIHRRTRHSDGRRAGHDRRRRPRQSPRHARRRSRHGFLAADYGGAGDDAAGNRATRPRSWCRCS